MAMIAQIASGPIERKGVLQPPSSSPSALTQREWADEELGGRRVIPESGERDGSSLRSPRSSDNWPREQERLLRILLVEDDELNQLVTADMLQDRGHAVFVAKDGKAALEILVTEQPPPFDIIVMDLVMPHMNGVEVTAAIRRREQDSNTHIPIIAMTGCATENDRQRCLDSGMDGYIAKPIEEEAFLDVISRMVCRSVPGSASIRQCVADIALDARRLLARLDNDVQFLRKITELYFDVCSTQMTRIRESVASRDSKTLQTAAHKLKSSVSTLSAKPTFEAALKLEEVAESGDVAAAPGALATLEKEVSRLNAQLTSLVEKAAGPPSKPTIGERAILTHEEAAIGQTAQRGETGTRSLLLSTVRPHLGGVVNRRTPSYTQR